MSGLSQIPRLLLVDGDPVLGMDAIIELRNKWDAVANGGLRWIEMCPPPKKNPTEFLNALDGEVAMSDWAGEHKVIFLRGFVNLKQFKDALSIVSGAIAPGNTFLMFDETGVIAADRSEE